MYIRTYVYMYIRMCVCIYVHTYVRMYIRMYIRMCVCIYVHKYVRMYICTYVRMCVCITMLVRYAYAGFCQVILIGRNQVNQFTATVAHIWRSTFKRTFQPKTSAKPFSR